MCSNTESSRCHTLWYITKHQKTVVHLNRWQVTHNRIESFGQWGFTPLLSNSAWKRKIKGHWMRRQNVIMSTDQPTMCTSITMYNRDTRKTEKLFTSLQMSQTAAGIRRDSYQETTFPQVQKHVLQQTMHCYKRPYNNLQANKCLLLHDHTSYTSIQKHL